MSELADQLEKLLDLAPGEELPRIAINGLSADSRQLLDALRTVAESRNDLYARYRRTLSLLLADSERLADALVRIGLGNFDLQVSPVETHALKTVRMGIEDMRDQLRQSREKLDHLISKLSASEERFRQLVESTSDWIWEVDRNGVYQYCSPQVETMLGYKPEEVIGRTPFDLMPGAEADKVSRAFRQAINSAQPLQQLENRNLHKNGSEVIMESSATPYFDQSGAVMGYRGVDRDITRRKIMEEELRFLANHDALTELHNRQYFQKQLLLEMLRAQRYQSEFVVLMLDIDYFKRVNDEHGHLVGDEVLKEFAHRLKNLLRLSDLVARYGGEEFVVLLPETDLVSAEQLAHRICQRVSTQRFMCNAKPTLAITTSIGLAAFPTHATDWQNMIGIADTALYEAKRCGRNQVKVASQRAGDGQPRDCADQVPDG